MKRKGAAEMTMTDKDREFLRLFEETMERNCEWSDAEMRELLEGVIKELTAARSLSAWRKVQALRMVAYGISQALPDRRQHAIPPSVPESSLQ